MTVDDALELQIEKDDKRIKCLCLDCEQSSALASEVRRLRAESDAAGRVLSVIDEMMQSFKAQHADGEGPNNLEFDRLFESILDVLNEVRP